MWLLWPGLYLQICQFCYSFTPWESIELNSKRNTSPKGGKSGYWSAFSPHNPHFSWKYLIKNVHCSIIKKCRSHTQKLTCVQTLSPWFTCHSTEPFTKGEVVMQENFCIAFSYVLSWLICLSTHVFTGSLDKHNVDFKVSSIRFNVDKKPPGKAGALQS